MSPTDKIGHLTEEQRRQYVQQLLQQRIAHGDRFPMSVQQQGLWYDYRRDPKAASYNVQFAVRLRSHVDAKAVRRMAELIVARHSCLRTTFADTGGLLWQQVHPSLPPHFEVVPISAGDVDAIRRRIEPYALRPFDLQRGPMMRWYLFQIASDDFLLMVVTHHIVIDFWSVMIVLSELHDAYRDFALGIEPQLPAVANHYQQYVRWQQQWLNSEAAAVSERFWRETLSQVDPVLDLPTDYIRPRRLSGLATTVPLELPNAQVQALDSLGAAHGVTLHVMLLTVLQVLLYRYSGQSTFCIGSPFAGRQEQRFERTVGFFVNMLPLPVDFRGQPSFSELLQRTAAGMLSALDHQALPLARIVSATGVVRDPARSPLFQVSCTFESSHLRGEQRTSLNLLGGSQRYDSRNGLESESFAVPVPTARYDLEFIFERRGRGVQGAICGSRDLFAPATLRQIASHFLVTLDDLVMHPDQRFGRADHASGGQVVPSQRPSSHAPGLVKSGADNPADGPATDLTWFNQRWRQIVRQHSDRPALIQAGRILTYRQTDRLLRQFTQQLSDHGVGRGAFVPVLGPPGVSTTLAILSVLNVGATVIPLDSNQPAASLREVLRYSATKHLLLSDNCLPMDAVLAGLPEPTKTATIRLDGLESPASLQQVVRWADPVAEDSASIMGDPDAPSIDHELVSHGGHASPLAYVIYTSGSTGTPKGVVICHAALAHTLQGRQQRLGVNCHDRFLVVLSHQFDAGLGVLLGALTSGAALVWPDHHASDVDALVRTLRQHAITILPAIASLHAALVMHPRLPGCVSLRQLWSGGESMSSELPRILRERHPARLWNFYGPTEATIEVTAVDVTDHDPQRPVPLGKPFPDVTLCVVDEQHRVLPEGIPGQLAIAGPRLAVGYLGSPQQTAERFIHTDDGRRLYLTGDRIRRLVDGTWLFLGRMDDQIKYNGYRLEPEEIEHCLQVCPQVVVAAVHAEQPRAAQQARDQAAGPLAFRNRLVAYVELSDEANGEALEEVLDSLRQWLADRLPPYKRPGQYCIVDSIPRSASGKIDRQKLKTLPVRQHRQPSSSKPRSALECELAAHWARALGIEEVGIDRDFFALGGSSLAAATLAVTLSDALQMQVPASLLFDLVDIASLGRYLARTNETEVRRKFGEQSIRLYQAPETVERDLQTRADDSLIVPLGRSGRHAETDSVPFVMIHPPGGIVACYRELAEHCQPYHPFYAVRSRGLSADEPLPGSLQEMAADYVHAIQQQGLQGPLILGGWSLGGIVAYEVARQWLARSRTVTKLVLLDTTIPAGISDQVSEGSGEVGQEYGLDLSLAELLRLNPQEQLPLLWQHARQLGVLDTDAPEATVQRLLGELKRLFHHHLQLVMNYRLQPLPVSVLLVRPRDIPVTVTGPTDRGWSRLVPTVHTVYTSGQHHSMIQSPHVQELARHLTANGTEE